MKSQIEFAAVTRMLEKQYAKVISGFLAYAADRLQTEALTTAEKYTLLTAFVEEYTTGEGSVSFRIAEMSGVDETATKLAAIMAEYKQAYGLDEKLTAISEQMTANNQSFAEWEKANRPQSPLFPN